jgi:hypothetical protein
MEEKNNSVIQAEFEGLKELINEKFANVNEKFNGICKEIAHGNDIAKGHDNTLKEHNGRLSGVEKLIEQGKGAGKVIGGFWGLVGGGVISLIVYFLTKHL